MYVAVALSMAYCNLHADRKTHTVCTIEHKLLFLKHLKNFYSLLLHIFKTIVGEVPAFLVHIH